MKKLTTPVIFRIPILGGLVGYLQQMMTFRVSVVSQDDTTSLAEVQLQASKGPSGSKTSVIWMRPIQAHCVEVFLTPVGPSWLSCGSEGAKKGPKNEIFHVLAVLSPKRSRGRSSSKYKS